MRIAVNTVTKMKALKPILWCALAVFAIQLIATVAYKAYREATPGLLATIASKGRYAFWISELLLVFAVLVFIFLLSRRFEYQRRNFVLTDTDRPSARNRFRKLLTEGTYVHVREPAELLTKYAALAAYVYRREKEPGEAPSSPPDGWRSLRIDLLDNAVQQCRGLQAEALIDDEAHEIAIVFRGTDEYSDIFSYLGGRQYTAVAKVAEGLPGALAKFVGEERHCNVVAVGHSLGGGLAQCLAYHATENEEPVVKRVYAFNTTPVGGIPKPSPRPGIEINLVFERAEILAYLRFVYECSWSAFKEVKVYRFNFSKSRDPLLSHDMSALWANLREARDLQVPGSAALEDQRQQRELVYDYIKFHIGLYLATPPIIALLAQGLGVEPTDPNFVSGMILMLLLYFVAGAHAGWFMGETINMRWESDNLEEFNDRAFDPIRRFVHHWMYWAGVGVGLSGILFALI